MRPIERGEILGLAEYEQIREQFRARVVAQKKRRRVQVGPQASALFENRDTVLLQIQEMLRTERITRAGAVQHELDTYNELVPGAGEISCTLMVEIADKEAREAFLVAAKGLEKHVWLVAGSQRMQARSIDRGGTDARTTAVHYLRFTLSPPLAEALRGAATGGATVTHVELVVDHPAYEARAVLPLETILELGEDQIA
ncbi:MAG TPA: DUF3501 family protein [Polyangiaceae bacterium]|jgi:hypothetical protein|nr:DUF3501 family protein [Polyangiaceae bacterium]